jgi:hypothetical protein
MGEIRQLAVELREKELDLSKSRQFERRVSELEAELLQASSDIDFSHGLSHTQILTFVPCLQAKVDARDQTRLAENAEVVHSLQSALSAQAGDIALARRHQVGYQTEISQYITDISQSDWHPCEISALVQ